MKYYWLTNSIDEKEVGKYEQSLTAINAQNLFGLGFSNKKIEEISPPEPILVDNAFPTSYLKSVPINALVFLILNQEFVEFLKGFKVNNFQTWDIKVHHQKKVLNEYNLFHIFSSSEKDFIEFKKSDFLIGKLGDWKDLSTREKVVIDSFNSYIKLIEELRNRNDKSQIRCDKLILNLSNTKLDIFRLNNMPYFGNGYYVSERLKNAIQENGFSGMNFKEIDKRIEVIY